MRWLSLVTLPLLIGAASAVAGETTATFETKFEKIVTLSARFTQTLTSKGFGATGVRTGTVRLLRPGKMRWDYDEPKGKVVVADGASLWLYEPEEKRVYRQSEGGLLNGKSPALFLAGTAPLAALFDITPVQGKNGKTTAREATFRLIPKEPQPGLKGMLLTLADDGTPVSLTAVDHLGAKNRFDFTDVVADPPLATGIFSFTPPAGARVVEAPTR